MQSIAVWLPQTYMIRSLRAATLAHAAWSDLAPDFTALMLFGLFWLVTGYVLFQWMERRSRQTGSIGQY
jgi:ABC-type multidrug transport system permease subunit